MYRETLFDAAGDLRDAYYAVDWSKTPLGAPSDWSLALRNTVDLALHTDFPVTLLWGPEFVLVYNTAYTELIADKHPAALGQRAQDVFPEAWDAIGPMLQQVYEGRGGVHQRDMHLPLQRRNRLEEAWFDFTYSPVRGADGLIEGVLDITAETTDRVVTVRRMQTLTELRQLASLVDHEDELRSRAVRLLCGETHDFPDVELQPAADGSLPDPSEPITETCVATTSRGRIAWLPLGDGGDRLAVRLSEHLTEDRRYLGFLELIAATLAQAMGRISRRETERDVAQVERRMSETLQQSMLTRPVGVEDTRVATRYITAAEQAHVGGDWYDAFVQPDGSLALVIGDVTGHDRTAAAGMAQVKSMLRALAITIGKPPGAVLQALDGAMEALELDVYASCIFARVTRDDRGQALEWTNAGHPPPVLVAADGTTTLLEREPQLMLGVTSDPRADHRVELPPGSSAIFYTDGLVERRHAVLDEGFDRLLAAARDCAGLAADQLADRLLEHLAADAEDDVALLVLSTPAEG